MQQGVNSTSPIRPGNLMGATSFGSFAPVGEVVTSAPTDLRARNYLAVEVGEACQLRCRHCIYHRPKSGSPKPNGEVLQEVATVIGSHFHPTWITLAGKEPTLFPKQLSKIARQLSHPDRLNILMSNGLLLTDRLIGDLAEHIDLFDISLDGTEKAHDWMRGQGTYQKTWQRIHAILARTNSRVGVISTAVHANVDDEEHQNDRIVELAEKIVADYGTDGRIVLSISLYYGHPDDPMRLNAGEIAALIEGLRGSGCPTRILFTANYSHLWPRLSRSLGISAEDLEFDVRTGFPVVRLGAVNIILFNLTLAPQISARVSNDGLVYLGCNHLVLGDDARRHAVADLSETRLADVLVKLADGSHPVYDLYKDLPPGCAECSDLELCHGGDRLSGRYFEGESRDPYCDTMIRDSA